MSTVVGIIIVCALLWFTTGRYLRVMSRKRYAPKQTEPPDLSRFAGAESSDESMGKSVINHGRDRD